MLPDRSSCNPQASLLTVRASPNFGLRSPGLCAGCKCCIILPEHKDFWEDRLLKNQAIVQMERTNSRDQYSKIAMSRVVQSRAVLRMISNATGDASDRSGES